MNKYNNIRCFSFFLAVVVVVVVASEVAVMHINRYIAHSTNYTWKCTYCSFTLYTHTFNWPIYTGTVPFRLCLLETCRLFGQTILASMPMCINTERLLFISFFYPNTGRHLYFYFHFGHLFNLFMDFWATKNLHFELVFPRRSYFSVKFHGLKHRLRISR